MRKGGSRRSFCKIGPFATMYPTEHSARVPRAGRRPFPPCARPGPRADRARPSRRVDRRQQHRWPPRRRDILGNSRRRLPWASRRIPMRRHIGPGDAIVLGACHAPDCRKPAPTWCTATAPKAAPMRAWHSMPGARCAPIRRTVAACCSATTDWPANSISRPKSC